ncbi:NuoM family protein [Nitrosospira sp. NpAV]|uniref:complex I subunit 4 family protein n=1 Tax=Nitrosospira sp. NpAV TaxID=58133 RepID=UPI000A00D3CF|nr:NADH-quinone oxidoreductase subunit M [Nitrosospira sp. NpAV]
MITNVSFWSESLAFPLVSTLTLVPLTAMFAVLFSRSFRLAIGFGFAGTLLNVALSFYLLSVFDPEKAGTQLAEQERFFDYTYYSVGVDGLNILFIPLTAILALLVLVYKITTQRTLDWQFIACLLGYEAILIGAFSALNVMQFWFWTLLELAPVILLTVHGGTGHKKRWVITRLVQYWGWGLLMTLAGFLLLGFGLMDSGHALSFDWMTLKQNKTLLKNETLIFILLFCGFAIRMPLFPFHGWLPILAQQSSVASVTIFLVGLKLGVYATARFILPVVTEAAEQWAGFVVTLGLISIFYGALLALMQINIRRLLAFSVISHVGMLVIGIFCFNEHGLNGGVFLSLAWGLASAGMLFSIGLVYERTHTAFTPRLGGLFDTNISVALLFFIGALSTMVMPGTPGFDAAHLLIEGTIEEYGWVVAIAILVGNVLAAAFLLLAFQQIFMAPPKRAVQPHGTDHYAVRMEPVIAVTICSLLIGTGFNTAPWLNYIERDPTGMSAYYHKPGEKHPKDMQTKPVDGGPSKDSQHD